MQIIELYIKGYNRINGSAKGFATNKLVDTTAEFTQVIAIGDIVTNLRTNEVAKITAVDSDTQLSISDDIFVSPNYDLYRIESDYFRADLFEDESVVITDSLLNVKDIKKVFTPFSQQFNLPASKLNNKLFRHYENFNIENSFDARYRHDAIIKLNGIDYKKGQIQFKSVSLKDNKAHAYKVVFYGDAVELKEVLGDTKLSGLNFPNSLNFEYNSSNIFNLFTNTDSQITSTYGSTDVLVPNIQHSKNMRYTTTDGYKDDITATELSYTDLKPAIRCRTIIEAINNTFPQINLTGFFNSTPFSNIYMWLHKNEGYITNAVEGGSRFVSRSRFRNPDDDPLDYNWTSSTGGVGDIRPAYLSSPLRRYVVTINISTVATDNYDLLVTHRNGATLLDETGLSSSQSRTFNLTQTHSNPTALDFTVQITSDSTIAMSHTLEIDYESVLYPTAPTGTNIYTANYTAANSDVSNEFIIADQMPEMKVMDFLSGLFKMFNLVVFKDGDNIDVQRASFYMNIGNKYDITKYVDMSTSNIERLFPYKEMEFKFKSKKSFLVQYSDEIQGIPFSQENYPETGAEFDGGVYKVELPFEKMMYERLSDETGAQTYIGQGAMLDKKFDPTIGEPLLLAIHYEANTNNELTIDGTTPTHYRRPSNLTDFSWAAGYGRMQLNFGLEADEWLGEIPSQNTNLFEENYFDYVESVFNKKGRMLKVDAYLPLSLITKYKLNDRFIINNTSFRINSIKTNLLTNKTQLELYNKEEYASQINNGQVAYLDRVAQLTSPSKTSNSIDLSWTAVTGVVGYEIILNGGVLATTVGTSIKVTPLEPDTTYTLGVRAKYNISGTDLYSFDTGITVTTLPPPVALAEDGDTLITEVGDTIILE